MRPTSTPPCGAGLNAIRASTSTSPRPPGSTWSSACSPISPVVVCVGDAFAVSPNSNQRSDPTLTTATPLPTLTTATPPPNRSFGPKGPTPSFENTNGLNGTLVRGRDTSGSFDLLIAIVEGRLNAGAEAVVAYRLRNRLVGHLPTA